MKSFWKTLTSALRLTYGVAPVYFLIANLFNIAQGVSMGLYTIAMAHLLDCAEGGGITQRLLLLAAAAAGIQVLRFKNVEIEQLRIPVDGSWNYDTIDGLSYVVINYNDNKNAVQQFLAGEYVPPENQ